MKNKFKLSLLIILIVLLSFSLSSCKDGSVDELYGVYGFQSLYYRDKESITTNYADKFDYMVMVVNENNTIDLYTKVHNGEEEVRHFNFTINFSEDDNGETTNKVSSIHLEHFVRLKDYKNSETVASNNYALNEIDDVTMNYGNLTGKLKYYSVTITKNSSDSLTFPTYRNNYEKMYNKISEKTIEKAKEKLTNEISDRANNNNIEE